MIFSGIFGAERRDFLGYIRREAPGMFFAGYTFQDFPGWNPVQTLFVSIFSHFSDPCFS